MWVGMYSKYLIKMGFLELARRRHWILIALRIWRSDQAAPKMNLKETQASVGMILHPLEELCLLTKTPTNQQVKLSWRMVLLPDLMYIPTSYNLYSREQDICIKFPFLLQKWRVSPYGDLLKLCYRVEISANSARRRTVLTAADRHFAGRQFAGFHHTFCAIKP